MLVRARVGGCRVLPGAAAAAVGGTEGPTQGGDERAAAGRLVPPHFGRGGREEGGVGCITPASRCSRHRPGAAHLCCPTQYSHTWPPHTGPTAASCASLGGLARLRQGQPHAGHLAAAAGQLRRRGRAGVPGRGADHHLGLQLPQHLGHGQGVSVGGGRAGWWGRVGWCGRVAGCGWRCVGGVGWSGWDGVRGCTRHAQAETGGAWASGHGALRARWRGRLGVGGC